MNVGLDDIKSPFLYLLMTWYYESLKIQPNNHPVLPAQAAWHLRYKNIPSIWILVFKFCCYWSLLFLVRNILVFLKSVMLSFQIQMSMQLHLMQHMTKKYLSSLSVSGFCLIHITKMAQSDTYGRCTFGCGGEIRY